LVPGCKQPGLKAEAFSAILLVPVATTETNKRYKLRPMAFFPKVSKRSLRYSPHKRFTARTPAKSSEWSRTSARPRCPGGEHVRPAGGTASDPATRFDAGACRLSYAPVTAHERVNVRAFFVEQNVAQDCVRSGTAAVLGTSAVRVQDGRTAGVCVCDDLAAVHGWNMYVAGLPCLYSK
jgi:hypothetical protein